MTAIVVCPVCHAPLRDAACPRCARIYSIDDGVLNLTPIPPPDPRVQARWALWEQLQANGETAYRLDPPSSLSVGDRADAKAFAAFADLRGVVLDIGCGVQTLPSYGRGIAGHLVGVDPLRGVRHRDFQFVQGIAEYLPFADDTFDRVLFATSIDHVLVAELAVAEARRVTRPGGAVCVWLGEPDPEPLLKRLKRRLRRPKPEQVQHIQTPRTSMTFAIPPDAIDAFHVAHPDARTVTGWLQQAGLTVDAIDRSMPGHCFLRARRE